MNHSSPTRPISLLLIRHAESERNKAKKGATYFADDEARAFLRGTPDHEIPLSSFGIAQAQQTGPFVRERFGIPDYFYHSGYLRTIQTTEEILKAYTEEERKHIKVRPNLFIRERDSGYAYDMTKEEAEGHFPWLKEEWETKGGFFGRPPGGESLADVAHRAHLFLNTLFRDRAGMNVFATIHGGTLRCFRFLLEHWSYDQALRWPDGHSPKNCGLTYYQYDPEQERLVLREYNTICWDETGHPSD